MKLELELELELKLEVVLVLVLVPVPLSAALPATTTSVTTLLAAMSSCSLLFVRCHLHSRLGRFKNWVYTV